MRAGINQALRRVVRQSVLWLKIAVLIFAGLAPALMSQSASAGQLTSRKSTISTSQGGATGVSYQFDFTLPSAIDVEGIIFEFCTTPLGTCTKPPGLDIDKDVAAVSATQTFSEATLFAEVGTSTGDCNIAGTNADTKYCVNRTDADNETAIGKQLTITGVTNPTLSGSYITVYIRISLYNNNTFTPGGGGANIVHTGTVAAGITSQLTAVGRVAERLKFCVAAMDDATALPVDCDTAFPTDTTVDLGIIDNISVTAAPVDPSIANANLSNDKYGILMVNTNASSGIAVTYYPEVATSVVGGDTDQLRRFRVIPTDCSATTTSTTDQCFISADYTSVTGETIVAGTERFGLAVACFNTDNGTTDNFDPANGATWDGTYDGDGDDEDTGGDDCENESIAAYSWGFRDDGTPDALVTSTSVVDDEVIKLRFGASASATTPTGTYAVVTTYIATPTF